MRERDYYWIDPDLAAEACRRMGLSAFGCMGIICALAYTRDVFLPADDDDRAARQINCSTEEWKEIKTRLLEGADVVITDGMIVPAAKWARPELDG